MPMPKGMLQKTHDEVIKLKTVLLGANGDEGLIGEIKNIKTDVKTLNNRQHRMSRNFWLLIGILVGSGILGTGVWNLLT